ncbi:hypothetical protein [Alteribacillus iranensis]|uniref:Uncharacterized protein n=1 Tax=Alteribacillus iranensis TaxID=930128 RepID=A0A1I2A8N3_9BACI|nr:hypothetical protein [Alteribacillus iranensis]SFE39353.1 hypothetical protein SAMN05192532_101680 [Alteribacillus iranensis]
MPRFRRAVFKDGRSLDYMEEAGHELGFFRNLEEIKSLAAITNFFKHRKDKDKEKSQNKSQ